MRFTLALPVALLITTAVFLFMQGLIGEPQPERSALAMPAPVDIFQRPPPPPDAAEPKPAPEQVGREEPVLEAIAAGTPAPLASPELAMPEFDLAPATLELPLARGNWSIPLGVAADGVLAGNGTDAQGFVEVVPFNTRKPNVPELAWKNKVSGWVLVAFNIDGEGHTRNIRVLDARPRGLFEEKVLAAVSDWQYSVQARGPLSGQVVMTQRIEIDWEDYPMNTPNVD